MKVALAYSGGLDTSVAARWLAEEGGHEVVAVTVDVGQEMDADVLRARAEAAGAELRVVDARRAFVEEYCWPALAANALYEGKYPLVSSLARPLIASVVVEVAREVGAGGVAHGCTGKGNDQVRFETTFAALAPDLRAFAPVREAAMSRDEARARAGAWNIPISAESKVYSVDENLWGRTVECGPLEDPWQEPPAEAFALTADPTGAGGEAEDVVVAFEGGVPVSLDGRRLPGIELVPHLAAIGGRHGFGRVDMIENRLVGIKSRELYEVPGSLALILAHRDLEDLTIERDLAHEKAGLERRWAELAYNGQWHGPLHRALRAFVAATQEDVTGEVRLRFHAGSCWVIGRRSDRALYDLSLATYEAEGDRFDHRQAEGFVRLWSLPIRTWAAAHAGHAANARPDQEPLPHEAAAVDGERVGTGQVGADGQTHAATPAGADGETQPATPAGADGETQLATSVGSDGRAGAASAVGSTNRTGEPAVVGPSTAAEPTWSGRFSTALDPDVLAFTRSLDFDRRLGSQDVRATAAHVAALQDAGVLTEEEATDVQAELERIERSLAEGTFPWSDLDEDVHSAIERVLTERLGATGAKVHAGRSRNDLVVTDLRLWTVEAAGSLAEGAASLVEALAGQAARNQEAVMPGYTHLQRAQPILLAHHLLAHAAAVTRDAERLLRAGEGAAVSCLGAGALAGSTIPLATDTTARRLGLPAAFENSIDAVSDRDFALEFLSAGVILAVHLSRLGEDIVLWSTQEFGFARVAEAHATGSSMMPQKRNPDVAELVRAKAGRVLGDLVALATVMKGLPLAYDRDLQEDKEPVFDAYDTLAGAVAAMSALVSGIAFDHERMRDAATGTLLATDLAEHLVSAGMPFREAHRLVGGFVSRLEGEGRTLADVRPDEWAALSPLLGPEVADLLTPEAAVTRRTTPGGTSPGSVEVQLAGLGPRLATIRDRAKGLRAGSIASVH